MKSFPPYTAEFQLLVRNSLLVSKIHWLLSTSHIIVVLAFPVTSSFAVLRVVKWLPKCSARSQIKIIETVHYEILQIPSVANIFQIFTKQLSSSSLTPRELRYGFIIHLNSSLSTHFNDIPWNRRCCNRRRNFCQLWIFHIKNQFRIYIHWIFSAINLIGEKESFASFDISLLSE